MDWTIVSELGRTRGTRLFNPSYLGGSGLDVRKITEADKEFSAHRAVRKAHNAKRHMDVRAKENEAQN